MKPSGIFKLAGNIFRKTADFTKITNRVSGVLKGPGLLMLLLVVPGPVWAAESLNGAALALPWAMPFLGLLLSIAVGPVLFHHVWEQHYGKIAAFWAVMTVLPLTLSLGAGAALAAVLHVILLEYMSFIILLFTLYTVAGGILIAGNLRGTPGVNTGLLAIGTMLASVIGTTGASMILIRPLIRANAGRRHLVHIVVFFIFLVSNIGGALTPLGDPPLFLGFLKGVDFFWTARALIKETALSAGALLVVFYCLDRWLYRSEPPLQQSADAKSDGAVSIIGIGNIALLGSVIVVILLAASWKPGFVIPFPGGAIELQNLVRDIALLGIAAVSLKTTAPAIRAGNAFNFGPIAEVAKLFAGIFICMIPVMAMLQAGKAGPFSPLIALISNPDGSPNNAAYFWLTGMLSAFLDNAPTYLVFFELAGGDAKTLMGPLSTTLSAISLGAVFMGALSYIGNAPNMMVAVIAREMGVRMPSFFGYLAWSFGILGPLLVMLWWVGFR